MLDAPGGHGKTFVLETIVDYCNKPENNYLALCSAYSGTIIGTLVNTNVMRCCITTIAQWNDNP